MFETEPGLLSKPYRVKSSSSPEAFQLFLDSLQGKDVEVTQPTYQALSSLSQEFGFGGLSQKLAEFRTSPAFSANDNNNKKRISFLEEQFASYEQRLLDLETRLLSSEQRLERLEATRASQKEQLKLSLERVCSVEVAVEQLQSSSQKQEAAVCDLRCAVAGQESGRVSELSGEVELLKHKVSEIASIRNDLSVAMTGISLLAAVLTKDLAQFLGQWAKAKCTIVKTGRTFVFQPIWRCRTCGWSVDWAAAQPVLSSAIRDTMSVSMVPITGRSSVTVEPEMDRAHAVASSKSSILGLVRAKPFLLNSMRVLTNSPSSLVSERSLKRRAHGHLSNAHRDDARSP
jgi:hypothetical protein